MVPCHAAQMGMKLPITKFEAEPICGLCRDFRAGEMAGLPNRVSIAVSVPIAASILCMEPQAQLAGKKW
jgi:hypothetical protein